MWGGRFADRPDAIMEEINASIGFDRRLADEDIRGSQAHAAMLAACGIISDEDHRAISQGLETVRGEIESGAFAFRRDLEDIHMNIENRLRELIGAPAGRLHTARSRNDQVATDFRLWVKGQCEAATAALDALIAALVDQAEAGAETVMPGFTHLQVAQPVTWGHHMLAYAEMFARDRARFADARALALAAMTGMVADMQPNVARLREAAAQGFSTATDLADWLVRELGMPFRDAHHVTGSLVKIAEDRGCDLADLSLETMQSVEGRITQAVYDVLTVEASVRSRVSYGGTAPVRVGEQVAG